MWGCRYKNYIFTVKLNKQAQMCIDDGNFNIRRAVLAGLDSRPPGARQSRAARCPRRWRSLHCSHLAPPAWPLHPLQHQSKIHQLVINTAWWSLLMFTVWSGSAWRSARYRAQQPDQSLIGSMVHTIKPRLRTKSPFISFPIQVICPMCIDFYRSGGSNQIYFFLLFQTIYFFLFFD